MRPELVEILKCLKCGASGLGLKVKDRDGIEVTEGVATCGRCGLGYPISGGVLNAIVFSDPAIIAAGKSYQRSKAALAGLSPLALAQRKHLDENYRSDTEANFKGLLSRLETGAGWALDIGAGTGWTTAGLSAKGFRAVAIDISADNKLELGRQHFGKDICFDRVLADVNHLPFCDGCFSLAFASAALHHSRNLGTALREIFRTLGTGGSLEIINEPVRGLAEAFQVGSGHLDGPDGVIERHYGITAWLGALRKSGFCGRYYFPASIKHRLMNGRFTGRHKFHSLAIMLAYLYKIDLIRAISDKILFPVGMHLFGLPLIYSGRKTAVNEKAYDPRRPETENNPARLLFLVWGGIGNMVLALPMIQAARQALPDAQFTVLAQSRAMLDLLADYSRLKKLALDDNIFGGFWGKIKLLGMIRERAPKATISTVPSPRLRSGMLAFLSGSGIRVCDREYGSPLFNAQVSAADGRRHQLYRNQGLLRPLGINPKAVEYRIEIPKEHRLMAEEYLSDRNISGGETIIGLHPGAGNRQKRWPAERFAAVGKALSDRGYRVMVFGGPEESELVDRVASDIGRAALGFAGDDDLKNTLALMKHCRLFISNDSGLAHCAAALGIPVIAVFGPTDPESCGPLASRVRVITNKVGCQPCYRPPNKYACQSRSPRCLDISAELVLKQVDGLMEESGHG